MRTFISGQSLSCILSAILSIFCQAFTSNNINDGRLFFFITIIWAIISICLFCYLANSKELKTFILKDSDDTNRIASIDSQGNFAFFKTNFYSFLIYSNRTLYSNFLKKFFW